MLKCCGVSETFNYFNYFTEIEEYFWKKRGAHLLVSPLDWAIVETWQKAGIPLEAALRGIDRAFESYARSRRGAAGKPLKSLAYCVDAVLEAAAEAQEAAAGKGPESPLPASSQELFSREELMNYLLAGIQKIVAAVKMQIQHNPALASHLAKTAESIGEMLPLLDSPAALDLEDLERRLTVLEEKLFATLLADGDEITHLEIRRELDRALSPYRRKMNAEQLALLEKQFVLKRMFEAYGLPRLSLFYLS
jgi:hypothetical protein